MTPQWSGYIDKIIANILINNDEAVEKIAELKELALKAWTVGYGLKSQLIVSGSAPDEALDRYFTQSVRYCFAGETFLNEREIKSDIYLNGTLVK
jgi:hypothetical protein